MKMVIENFWTWRKVALFFIIIGLGIMGLIFADQQDFLSGRVNTEKSIGNGTADPLVTGNAPVGARSPASAQVKSSGVDGIKKIPCDKKNC